MGDRRESGEEKGETRRKEEEKRKGAVMSCTRTKGLTPSSPVPAMY